MPRCQGLVFSISIMCRTHVLSTNMKGLIDTSLIYYLCCGALQLRICVSKKCLQMICANKENAYSSVFFWSFGAESGQTSVDHQVHCWVINRTNTFKDQCNHRYMGSFKVYWTSGNFSLLLPPNGGNDAKTTAGHQTIKPMILTAQSPTKSAKLNKGCVTSTTWRLGQGSSEVLTLLVMYSRTTDHRRC